MKNRTIRMMCVVLAAGLLAGCGKKADGDSGKENNAGASAQLGFITGTG